MKISEGQMDPNELIATREKTHGDFSDGARIMQSLKEQMRGMAGWSCLSAVQREALEMIQHKVGRILVGNQNHKDHWDDIAGYAALVSQRIEE